MDLDDLAELLVTKIKDEHERKMNRDLDAIHKRLREMQPLTALTPGDVLKQRKFGDEYRSRWRDRPVVFVRYTDARDRPESKGDRCFPYDIVVCEGLDARDGEPILWYTSSEWHMLAKDTDY